MRLLLPAIAARPHVRGPSRGLYTTSRTGSARQSGGSIPARHEDHNDLDQGLSLEPDPPARGLRPRHQLSDRHEHDGEVFIIPLLELIELAREVLVCREQLAQPNERPHDSDVHENRQLLATHKDLARKLDEL